MEFGFFFAFVFHFCALGGLYSIDLRVEFLLKTDSGYRNTYKFLRGEQDIGGA